jgi:hypothetical protein
MGAPGGIVPAAGRIEKTWLGDAGAVETFIIANEWGYVLT